MNKINTKKYMLVLKNYLDFSTKEIYVSSLREAKSITKINRAVYSEVYRLYRTASELLVMTFTAKDINDNDLSYIECDFTTYKSERACEHNN